MSSPTPTREPLPVEALVSADQRRTVSVGDHQAFREALTPMPFDDIDEALSDPIFDHLPQTAPKHKANRVLSILDQLDAENSNRRLTP